MKLQNKILGGFLLIGIFSIMISIFEYYSFSFDKLALLINEGVEENMPDLKSTAQLITYVKLKQVEIQQIQISSDNEEKQAEDMEDYNEINLKIDKILEDSAEDNEKDYNEILSEGDDEFSTKFKDLNNRLSDFVKYTNEKGNLSEAKIKEFDATCTEIEQLLDDRFEGDLTEFSEIADSFKSSALINLIILIIIQFCVIIFISIFTSRFIVKPLKLIVSKLHELSDGNLEIEVDKKLTLQKDEVGQIANSLVMMSNKWRQIIHKLKVNSNDVTKAGTVLAKIAAQILQNANNQSSTTE